MTKFEEVKRPVIGIGQSSIKPALGKAVEFYTDKVKEYHNTFSDMNKYIDHIEDKLDCANERIVLLEGTVDDLKSQLQQQALPVVPDFVAEWLDSNNLAGLLDEWYCHHEDMSSHIREYFEKLPYKGPNNLSEMENNIVTFITRAKLDGYTVEKPQLFKLIFPNSTAVLQKDGELNSFADTVYKRYLIENAMTEQEIKSIDERYWQFAVPVEDGE